MATNGNTKSPIRVLELRVITLSAMIPEMHDRHIFCNSLLYELATGSKYTVSLRPLIPMKNGNRLFHLCRDIETYDGNTRRSTNTFK